MSVAQINALYDTCIAALDNEDWDGAILAAEKAKIRLALMPDATRMTGGTGKQELEWANVQAIDSFIRSIRAIAQKKARASVGPWDITKIKYARASAED